MQTLQPISLRQKPNAIIASWVQLMLELLNNVFLSKYMGLTRIRTEVLSNQFYLNQLSIFQR